MNNTYCSQKALTNPNKCAIMVLPRHGKEQSMHEDTRAELLERIIDKLSEMTAEEVSELIRLCEANGIHFNPKPRI